MIYRFTLQVGKHRTTIDVEAKSDTQALEVIKHHPAAKAFSAKHGQNVKATLRAAYERFGSSAKDDDQRTVDEIARGLAELLDAKLQRSGLGFALFLFEFGDRSNGYVGYVSNGQKSDIERTVDEWLQLQRADKEPPT